MPNLMRAVLTLGLVLALAALAPIRSDAEKAPTVTLEAVETMMSELSNWGRWGEEDQLARRAGDRPFCCQGTPVSELASFPV